MVHSITFYKFDKVLLHSAAVYSRGDGPPLDGLATALRNKKDAREWIIIEKHLDEWNLPTFVITPKNGEPLMRHVSTDVTDYVSAKAYEDFEFGWRKQQEWEQRIQAFDLAARQFGIEKKVRRDDFIFSMRKEYGMFKAWQHWDASGGSRKSLEAAAKKVSTGTNDFMNRQSSAGPSNVSSSTGIFANAETTATILRRGGQLETMSPSMKIERKRSLPFEILEDDFTPSKRRKPSSVSTPDPLSLPVSPAVNKAGTIGFGTPREVSRMYLPSSQKDFQTEYSLRQPSLSQASLAHPTKPGTISAPIAIYSDSERSDNSYSVSDEEMQEYSSPAALDSDDSETNWSSIQKPKHAQSNGEVDASRLNGALTQGFQEEPTGYRSK